MAVPNVITYTGKLKINGEVIRFGGDTIYSGQSTDDLLIGVPILLPANSDSDNDNSQEPSADESNES